MHLQKCLTFGVHINARRILYLNRGRNIVFAVLKTIFRKRKRPMNRARPRPVGEAGRAQSCVAVDIFEHYL